MSYNVPVIAIDQNRSYFYHAHLSISFSAINDAGNIDYATEKKDFTL